MKKTTHKIADTTAIRKIFRLKKRIRAVAGGTSAGKTLGILIWCIDYAQSKADQVISVVSESFPHLEKGAILDFKVIMRDRGYWERERWNDTKHTYTFANESVIEFFSSDADKAHGPRRDVLFLNEAQNLNYEQVGQLMLRTRSVVWMDWNPTYAFWFYSEMLPRRDDIDFITLTYADNELLGKESVKELESRKEDERFWKVYGLGQLGEVEGLIYTDWKVVDEVPHEAKLVSYGMDFGYKIDPTAIVAIYSYNGGFVVDEIAFMKGLLNNQIADIFKSLPSAPIISDSAEPKSIDELRLYGLTILPSTKGKGSVSQGIAFVQQQRMSMTKRSVNVIKGQRNYLYQKDSSGHIINKPAHAFSDCMDAIRYGLQIKRPSDAPVYIQPPYETPSIDADYAPTVIVPDVLTPHRR